MNSLKVLQNEKLESVAQVMVSLNKDGRYAGKPGPSFEGPLEVSFESVLQPKQPKAIEQELRDAKPAEKTWDNANLIDAGVRQENLFGLQQHGDGVFVCCKGHENVLTHYEGRFPFKYAQCGRCNHALCEGCHTSGILIHYTHDTATLHKAMPADDGSENRLCRVCRACGLSHRPASKRKGFAFPEQCPCGYALEGALFLIGDVYQFRRDPVQQAIQVKMQHMEAASGRKEEATRLGMHRRANTAPLIQRATVGNGRLTRSNALSRRTRSEASVLEQRSRCPY